MVPATALGGRMPLGVTTMRERTFRKSFGHAVRSARDGAGMTQRDLAEKVGIAEKYLSRIELGLATPSVLIAANLASALGLSLDALTGGDKPAAPAGVAIARLLQGQKSEVGERALRIIRELLR